MPIPTPGEKEQEQDFVSRFMAHAGMLKDYPDQKQRAAVAYAQWRKAHPKAKAEAAVEKTQPQTQQREPEPEPEPQEQEQPQGEVNGSLW